MQIYALLHIRCDEVYLFCQGCDLTKVKNPEKWVAGLGLSFSVSRRHLQSFRQASPQGTLTTITLSIAEPRSEVVLHPETLADTQFGVRVALTVVRTIPLANWRKQHHWIKNINPTHVHIIRWIVKGPWGMRAKVRLCMDAFTDILPMVRNPLKPL